MIRQKVCRICGKTFETESRKQELCSPECRKQSKRLSMLSKSKEFYAHRNLKIKQARNTSESRHKTSVASKKTWQNEESRKKLSKSVRKSFTETVRKNISDKLKKHWKNTKRTGLTIQKPEIKAKICHTLDLKYGRCHWPCNSRKARKKALETAKRNNSWAKARQKGFDTLRTKPKTELYVSEAETEIKDFIISLGFSVQKTYISGMKASGEIDIFIPEKNIGIEYNGCYWHSIKFKDKYYHQRKTLLAKEQGIELIHIWEDMWKEKKDIVKSILSARLGILKNRIYARDCVIRNIDNIVYREFCIKNHIQGYRQASVRLGLYHNGELVQIASFSKSKNKKYEWEWVRGCPASNNIAIGGTSKLFSHFINIYNPDSVLCYADMNLFNGNGYSKCGFQSEGYTVPDKFYIKGYKRIMRNPAKYKEYMTLVKQNHLLLCYGAGSLIYTWTKNNEIQKS